MTTPPRFFGSARPTDVDGVIRALEAIVEWAWTTRSRSGYFAQVYLSTTRAVKEAIDAGEFEASERLARLDLVFALRYLDAFDAFHDGRRPSRSWQMALEADRDRSLLVLQHVLLGMNAHINLDLGVAAAEVAPGEALAGLRADFDRVNDILAGITGRVEVALGQTSPVFGLLDRLAGAHDAAAIMWSIRAARRAAWASAERLAARSGEELGVGIDALDSDVALLAWLIVGDPLSREAMAPLRWSEEPETRAVIEALRGI